MQIPKKTWDKYIKQLSSLNNTAGKLVADYIEENGIEDKKALTDYAYSVIQKYGNGSAALSAAMYDTIAAIEGASVPPAVMAELPQYDEVAKTVYGTLKTSHNTSEISSAASRLVKRTGADTTLWNVKRDGAQFAWVPAGDTCPFCLALASNGWQYMSKEAIKGGHAEHIHANCDCTYAVRFDNDTKVPGYDPKKYKEMYDSAEGNTPEDKINSLRRMKYEENKDKINAQKRAAYSEKKTENIIRAFQEGKSSDEICSRVIANHSGFKNIEPAEMKKLLENSGYVIMPLGSKSSLSGIPFEEGGGYRTTFYGDGYFQYHPEKGSHHDGAYWKINNGKMAGRYDLDGNETKG